MTASSVRIKEAESFKFLPSHGDDDTPLFQIETIDETIVGDYNLPVQSGVFRTNNLRHRIEMVKSYTGPLMYIGSYIEIYKNGIRNWSNDSFLSGFGVISLEDANTRKEAKSKSSLQLESGAVKLKYNSSNQLQIYNDLVKLISSDVQILQHTDNGDKLYSVCATCKKVESLSSLSNYEYDEDTCTLIINTIN